MDDQTEPSVSIAPAPPLVGRDRELAELRAALTTALDGRGALVLIGGEAGLGKTALAETLLAEAGQQGALVLVGHCYDLSETPPYGPWAEALTHAPRARDLPEPPDLAGGGAASQAALFAAVRDHLTALATRQPLVLLLEDLHWADPASLDLLRVLGRRLADAPLLLLATYRSDELTRRHPLYALLPLLEREARAARLDLRPLLETDLHALVGRYALAGSDAARLVAWLRTRAEGNAFFTAQLLRALEDEGVLRRVGSAWALGDLGVVGLPLALRQVLDARLARLGEEPQRLLTLAAVIGQEVPLALWAAVAETDEDGLLDTIERATEARLLAETADGVRFTHALVREALYAGTLAVRGRTTHRRAAEALAATPAPDPDAVAYHFQRAGDQRAAAWLVRAGERAYRAYAWDSAAGRYEAALALMEASDADPRARALLLIHLAQFRRYATPQDAIAPLEEAARLAAVGGDAALAAASAFDTGHLRCLAREYRRGLEQMTAALPALEALPPDARDALPTLSILRVPPAERERYHREALMRMLVQAGRFADARALGEEGGHRGSMGTARGLTAMALVHCAAGEPEQARPAFRAARGAFHTEGQYLEAGFVSMWELRVLILPYLADQVAERHRLVEEAEAEYVQARGVWGEVIPRMVRMSLLILEGQWAEARQLAKSTVEVWALGIVPRDQGDVALAHAQVRAILPFGPATEPGDEAFWQVVQFQRLAATLALDAGDLATAKDWIAAHGRWLDWSGVVLWRAEHELLRARHARMSGDPTGASAHAERALASATAPRQPLALLAAHRTLGELDTARGQRAGAAAHLDAALALADACAAPYERALTLLALAELHAAEEKPIEAGQLLAEARGVFATLGAPPALARADALAARLATPASPVALPFGLSAREAEVLRLAAQGLPNAEVGARLFLSPRTVEQHLRSVFGKLGVENRTAAAHLAVERGLA